MIQICEYCNSQFQSNNFRSMGVTVSNFCEEYGINFNLFLENTLEKRKRNYLNKLNIFLKKGQLTIALI